MLDLYRTRATLTGWLRLFALLGFTVVAIAILSTRPLTSEAMATMPWIACVFVCYLAPLFVSPDTDLFSPPGIVGLNGGLATAAMLAMIAQEGGAMFRPLGFVPLEERIELARGAAVLMMVAQLSYLFGYYRTTGELASRIFPAVGLRRWHGGRLLVVVGICTLMVVPFYVAFQMEMGGSLIDVTELGRGRQIIREEAGRSWMVRGIQFAFVPTLLLACGALMARSRRLLLLTAVVFVAVSILVTRLGGRWPAFAAGLMILVLFHLLWRRVRSSMVVLLLLISVSVVNTLGDYRTTGENDMALDDRLSRPAESMAKHEKDRNRLNVIGTILHYFPEHQGYLLGESYLPWAVFWVPRWIWPEKSTFFRWQGNRIVMRLVNLRAPVPSYGEMYANFSWVGVVIGMALFGVFHRGLYRYRENFPRDGGVALIYTTVVVTFSPTLLGVSALLQYALPVTLLVYAVSRRNPDGLPSGPLLESPATR